MNDDVILNSYGTKCVKYPSITIRVRNPPPYTVSRGGKGEEHKVTDTAGSHYHSFSCGSDMSCWMDYSCSAGTIRLYLFPHIIVPPYITDTADE